MGRPTGGRMLLTMALLGSLVPCAWAAASDRADFENRLSAFRKGMIGVCAQFQAGAPRESPEQLGHEMTALEATWDGISSDYRAAPPGPYSGDPKWPQYFDTVHESLVGMRVAVAGKRYGKALETCGAACALFVTLHESNGISTVCDRLFDFRKQAKLMVGQIKNGHPQAARSRLSTLLAQRDAVVLVPVPAKALAEKDDYLGLVKAFSNSVDAFAVALVNDSPDVALQNSELMMKALAALYNRYI